ncbi:MAG: tetratricopeptide repeat protein [Pedobacter sp.]|uniref:tetratricopeptide repeat protein n=1 Tax=Pedobacter sp. TaxID=1411316 RepID=UPI002806953E|nr:tetratricopeptide repeat protein [Pedobacter sp.]MDQ8005134.1 tetratricopeptide repeat protein [Pedobacter sp.]
MKINLHRTFKYFVMSTIFLLLISNLSAQDSSDEYFTMARVAGSKGNFAKAATYAEKGLKKSPLDMDIKEYLGKCYMELGQLDKARFTLLEVLKESPRRVDARHYLINIETQTKRYYSAVCYANELLEITPYSKGLWLRKIQLYSLMQNYVEANRSAKRLYQIFPEDNEIKSLYNNILREEVTRLNKSKDLPSSVDQFEKIIEIAPTDPEGYLNLINAYTKMGNYSAALSIADRGLQAIPFHQGILDKKIGLLDETHEYQKAIAVIEERMRKGESAHYKQVLNYMVSKAARFYKNSDPYVLYSRIYDQNPKDSEAFDYLLSTSISRGYFTQAEELINKSLKSNPNSKDLLAKQLYVYEAQKDWERAGNSIERLNTLYPNDADVKEKYRNWTYQKAKLDYNDQNYKEALWGFLKVSQTPEYKKYAAQYIFAIHNNQKAYADALKTINTLVADYPQENQYILNKIDLLMAMNDFESAYNLAKEQQSKNIDKPEFAHMYATASLGYIRDLNKKEDFEKVKTIANELLLSDPQQVEAYNYGIGARVAMKQYDEAIAFIQSKTFQIAQPKEFKLKLAGVYAEAGKHENATALLKELHQEYPFNDSIKNTLVEEMLVYAKTLDDSSNFAKSKEIYGEIRTVDPKNTTAAIKLTNILIEQGDLARSMQIVDSTLLYNKDYPDLLYQKGLIFEKMGDFKLAREYHHKFMKPLEKPQEHKDRLDYLESKELKNQVNVSYLNTTSDSTILNTSIASLEYLRDLNKNNKLVIRGNYAGRKTGASGQAEVDWYHTFNNKASFLANVGVANAFFPKQKVAFSYFQPFAKVWQAEIGARYARMLDNTSFTTGAIGIERTFNNVWFNAKALIMTDGQNLFNTVFAQSRFFMKNERNYVATMASIGTVPEDQRLLFQTNTFTNYMNTMVGAGYYHFINAKTSFGLQGNWYNFKVAENAYVNQYNLFLTLRTKF